MPNDPSGLIVALSNFGGLGIVIGFLIWHTSRSDAARLKLDQEHLADKRLQEERRLAYDRDRLETDKALVASLASLTAAIQASLTAAIRNRRS